MANRDQILENISTADFWRGLLYVISAVGVTVSPINANNIIAAGMGLSGILHLLFKKNPDEKTYR